MKERSLQGSYCLMQAALWGSYGFLFSYANRYLLDVGLSDFSVGVLLGIATALSFLAQPLLTSAVDRRAMNCRAVVMLCAGLMGLSCVVLLLWRGLWAQILLYAAACVCLQIIPSFSNALGMSCGRSLNFGLARGVGSVSFGLCAQAAVPLIARFGLNAVLLCTAALSLLLLLSTLPFTESSSASNERSASTMAEFFRKNPSFAVFLLGSVLLYVGHNVLSNCMFQIAEFKGDGDAQGTALLIAAAAELPTMFLFSRVRGWMSGGKWVCLSGIFFSLRLLLSWLLPGVFGLYAAQLTQLLGFALFAVSSVYYVKGVVEQRDAVKGQTYLGVTNTVGCLIAHVLGGALIDLLGVGKMLLCCFALSALGAVLLFAATAPRKTAAQKGTR